MFISFDGVDGAGKSTQVQLLRDWLVARGETVVTCRDPGSTSLGERLRGVLLDHHGVPISRRSEMLLYMAARAQLVEEIIRPALKRGAVVLSDRFTDSTLAYQGAARGSGRETVESLHEIACAGLWPDLTILLEIDMTAALDRAAERNRQNDERNRMDEQSRDFYRKVQAEYRQIAAREAGRVRIVDGGGSIQEVAARVWDLVSPLLH